MRHSCSFLFCFAVTLFAAPAFAEVQRFRIDPDASQIVTKINDPFGNVVTGTMRLRQGEARGDTERLQESASVSLLIDTNSYNSKLGLRDQDVQKDYLEVQRYPTIRFDSSGIQTSERPQSPNEPWQITVKGRLQLHGVEREVTVPVRLLYQPNKIIAQGNFRLLLDDFKIPVPRLLFLRSGDHVDVEFRIVGEREL